MSPANPGLYLHVPFCHRICPYCDFAVQLDAPGEHARLVTLLLREAELKAQELWRGTDTIYFGGGTPSLLAPAHLEELLAGLGERLGLAKGAKLHLEANPEDVTAEGLAAWRDLGLRFLSLGVQSFDDRDLHFLGRRHRREEALRAVHLAMEAGIETVSVDVIFGLPEQPAARLIEQVETVRDCGVQHISCYQLTVHEGTHFDRRRQQGRLVELPEDEQGHHYALLWEALEAAGFAAYEVSNFSKGEAHRSAHNLKYWRHAPYLGLGPSAHGFDGTERSWNLRTFARWARVLEQQQLPIEGAEVLTEQDLALETVMLSLRTAEGLDLRGYERRFGQDLAAANAELLARWQAADLMRQDGERLVPTRAGLAVADRLAAEIELP